MPLCKNAIDSNSDRIMNVGTNANFSPHEQTSQYFKTEQFNNNGNCMVGTTANCSHEIASIDVDYSKQQISEQFDESTKMVSPPPTTTTTTTDVIKEIPNSDKFTSMDNKLAESYENSSHKKPTNSSNESNENESMPTRTTETIKILLDTAISSSVDILDENDRTIVCTTTDVPNGPANNLYV